MRTLLAIGLCLAAVAEVAAAEPERVPSDFGVFSYPGDGRKIVFNVLGEHLEKTPIWQAQAENPPLSPRRAQKLAQATFDKLIIKRDDWKLERITLEDARDERHWFYIVEFQQLGGWGGRPPYVEIVVLMDGTVPEFKIEKDH